MATTSSTTTTTSKKSFGDKTYKEVSEDANSTLGEKLWKFFTEMDGWFNINLYETIHGAKNYTLKMINFLPLYVQRHIANDFYTKMFSQLYPDPPSESATTTTTAKQGIVDKITGAISNAAGAAVSKVTNTTANQITSTANYARNLISTLTFGLVDTSQSTKAGNNNSYSLVQTAIPHLKVIEIRLNDKLSQKGILFTCLAKMFQAGSNLAKNNSGMKDIGQKIANGFEEGLKALCRDTIHMTPREWLSKMSSGQMKDAMATRIGGLAYAFIRNSASGAYMNTYELPHFGESTMLSSIASDGFQGPPPTKNPILKMIKDMTGGNLTVQENISWKAPTKFTMGPFAGKFHLFNDNLQMYADNLDLILRLVTHSMPIRDSFMYRAPCCYDVTDVGNRRCYFCSGDFSVKKVGKIRLLTSEYNSNGSSAAFATNLITSIKKTMLKNGIPAEEINSDYINYVPDAFEIQYKFTPIISENYNTFIYYFMEQGGNPSTTVLPAYDAGKEGSKRDTTSTNYGADIDYLKDHLMKDFVDAFASAMGG